MEEQRKVWDKKRNQPIGDINKELYKGGMLLLEDSYNKKTGRLNYNYGYTTIVKGTKFTFKIEFDPDYLDHSDYAIPGPDYGNSPETDSPKNGKRFGKPRINIYTIGRFTTLQRDKLTETDYVYASRMHNKRKKLSSWEEDFLETAKKVTDEYLVRNQKADNSGNYLADNLAKSSETDLISLTPKDTHNISNLEELLLNDRKTNIQNLYKISMDLLEESYLKHEGTVDKVTPSNRILGWVYKGKKQNRIKITNLLESYTPETYKFNTKEEEMERLIISGKDGGLNICLKNGKRIFIHDTFYKPGKWEENLIKDPIYLRQHDTMSVKWPVLNNLLSFLPKTAAGLLAVTGALYGLSFLGTYYPSLARDLVLGGALGLIWVIGASNINAIKR